MARFSLVVLWLIVTFVAVVSAERRVFNLSADGTSFNRDGVKEQVLSGSLHYFRVLPSQWGNRIRTFRALGLNAIETYVPWNWHMPDNATVSWQGDRDLGAFLTEARLQNMSVLLRVGPYICAEWDFGGLPAWLLRHNRNLKVRTRDETFMTYVQAWWSHLLPIVKPHLYVETGGPVIMVQVENEYSGFGDDKVYLSTLRDWIRLGLGDDVLLYSTDANFDGLLNKTAIPGVFQGIDFFYYGEPSTNVSAAWYRQHQNVQTTGMNGPNFNPEFYPGWLTHWGDLTFAYQSDAYVSRIVTTMLSPSDNASNSSKLGNFNLYMGFGGTNFGFWPGKLVVTSYDYNAPVTEPGDPRPGQFEAVRLAIQNHRQFPPSSPLPPIPPIRSKTSYNPINLTYICDLLAAVGLFTDSTVTELVVPPELPSSMEMLGQNLGLIAYAFPVPSSGQRPVNITIVQNSTVGHADFVVIYCGNQFAGFVWAGVNDTVVCPAAPTPSSTTGTGETMITLVVDSFGRDNFGKPQLWQNSIGLPSSVLVNGLVLPAYNYTIRTIPLRSDHVARISEIHRPTHVTIANGGGGLYTGVLEIDPNSIADVPLDSFMDMTHWNRGVVLVNGFNVGRYWSAVGPQQSLYIPGELLKAGRNLIAVFELVTPPGSQLLQLRNCSLNTMWENPYRCN